MDSKSDIRIKAKALRKTLDLASKSKIAVQKLRESEEYIQAKNIMLFYPLRYEINLISLLNDEKNFFFPKTNNENILVCPYCKDFKISKFNVKEPCSNPINPNKLDLIIVPALTVDKNNYRLGYGKGFYDKFLSKYPDIKTITVIEKELIIEKLPIDNFDVKINKIIPL